MAKAKKTTNVPAGEPVFGEQIPTSDPTKNKIPHLSDAAHYKLMVKQVQPIPVPKDAGNLVMTLADAYGKNGPAITNAITKAGQIVFHAGGDTGPTTGPKTIEEVVDKMVLDYSGEEKGEAPSFFFHLGDLVYSFGESTYYYDQFFEPFRNYPAPIFAVPGNHDGLSYKGDREAYMAAFLRNFVSPSPVPSPDAGGLGRTTMTQPGVYFALDAPFVTILGLYSNVLEDPGVISSEGGKLPLTDEQLVFLKAQLVRLKDAKKCVIIAVHHPPFSYGGSHGGSPKMLADIDGCCTDANFWPHAVISGHAHSYQRFSRTISKSIAKGKADYETPYIVCGNSGHGLSKIGGKNGATLRAPVQVNDSLVFENYDDTNFGYLRIVCDAAQLRIEYHDAEPNEKTYSDAVTVDIASHTIIAN